MPIPTVKCKEHGLCRAEVVHVCKVCASESKVVIDNSVQQLKLEIAAVADELNSAVTIGDVIDAEKCVNKLRQLSSN